jgi:hypothetical protein
LGKGGYQSISTASLLLKKIKIKNQINKVQIPNLDGKMVSDFPRA